jgi:hypothetical protein
MTKVKVVEIANKVRYVTEQGDYLHRVDGPAISWSDGDWCWLLNDLMHRYYGPAHVQGTWYIHNEKIK